MSAEWKYMQLLSEMKAIYELSGFGTMEALVAINNMTYDILVEAGINPDEEEDEDELEEE